MPIYGRISSYKKGTFKTKFAKYYTLDPQGPTWRGLAETLDTFANHIEFRHSFSWTDMIYLLREMCIEAGLTPETRGEDPHKLEGFYGIEKI